MFKPSPTMTHSGWFWFCPVYLRLNDGDIEGCEVEARAAWLEWLFSCAEVFEGLRIFLSERVFGIEPMFMFSCVRPLKTSASTPRE